MHESSLANTVCQRLHTLVSAAFCLSVCPGEKFCPILRHREESKVWLLVARVGGKGAQIKSLKAANSTAANAPVAICWETAMAAPVAEAEALAAVGEAVLEPEPELPAEVEGLGVEEVDEAVVAAAAEVSAMASAVALRVPHCSLEAQVACP